MNTYKTRAIVLNRTNYAEADKIATVLTEDGNKISIIAKGVRKPKSKLVAAVELFVITELTYIKGKSSLYTVSSAKIIKQHTSFLNDLDKVHVAYDVIKKINKYTDDNAGASYYNILVEVFKGLEGPGEARVVELWAWSRILQEAGHNIQLSHQTDDTPFNENDSYSFDSENGGFLQSNNGTYQAGHIKLLKITQNNSIDVLCRVKDCTNLSVQLNPIVKQFVEYNI